MENKKKNSKINHKENYRCLPKMGFGWKIKKIQEEIIRETTGRLLGGDGQPRATTGGHGGWRSNRYILRK